MILMLFFGYFSYHLVSEVLVYELYVEIFTVLYSNKMNNLVKYKIKIKIKLKKLQHYITRLCGEE